MNSPAVFQDKQTGRLARGLTLIEVIIVISLISFVVLLSSLVDINYYRRELSASEVSILISALQKARGRAMNNIGATAHGVYLDDSDAYVIFRGNSFDPDADDNEYVPKNPNLALAGDFDEVYFEQLSGEPNEVGNITLSDGALSKTVSLHFGGLIDW